MNANQTAFCTSTTLAIATVASTFTAVNSVSLAARVACTALSILLGSVSIASITAWADDRSIDVRSYFSNLKKHSGYTIASMSQLVAQTLVQALVQGLAHGVALNTSRWVTGGDDIRIGINDRSKNTCRV